MVRNLQILKCRNKGSIQDWVLPLFLLELS